MEKRLRWQWRTPCSTSWRVDETYVKVHGHWTYLYRAVDKHGNTIDFYLSPTRNTAAAKRFLGKALNGLKVWETPTVINTDRAPTYAAALAELKKEGKCPEETLHRQVKYLDNVIEADHGKLKQLIRPVRGFKTLKFAKRLSSDYDAMRAAVTLAWSNGQVEGQVNRLKTLKLQMYGRANLDLLERRFLLAA